MKIFLIFIPWLFMYTIEISGEKSNNSALKNTYFPTDVNKTLVYQTSFGESFTKYLDDGGIVISSNESDKFKYRQRLLIMDNGVYVKETYQYLSIFLFIKKEATYRYNKPLLRLPFPLTSGKEWKWAGIEYCNDDSSNISVSGKVFNEEMVVLKVGNYKAMKVETVIDGSSNSKNTITEWFAENIGLVKAVIILDGGGIMGLVKNILGYGKLEFELKEIRNN